MRTTEPLHGSPDDRRSVQRAGERAVRHVSRCAILTPETAAKATRAALEDCRKRGFQVTVAVVDRAGVAQALMRDRFAGPHTVQTAINKGYTAVSFRTDTLEFAKMTQAGAASSGIRSHRQRRRSGRRRDDPGRRNDRRRHRSLRVRRPARVDEACARAGIAAIKDELEF